MRGAWLVLALAACFVSSSSCVGAREVRLEVPASAPRKGGGAHVVIQEAGDLQCPFCGRVQPTVRALMAAYAGRVELVWRNYPLSNHPHAALAAEAALEIRAQAGDAKFWAFHDALFANQDKLARAALEQQAE